MSVLPQSLPRPGKCGGWPWSLSSTWGSSNLNGRAVGGGSRSRVQQHWSFLNNLPTQVTAALRTGLGPILGPVGHFTLKQDQGAQMSGSAPVFINPTNFCANCLGNSAFRDLSEVSVSGVQCFSHVGNSRQPLCPQLLLARPPQCHGCREGLEGAWWSSPPSLLSPGPYICHSHILGWLPRHCSDLRL